MHQVYCVLVLRIKGNNLGKRRRGIKSKSFLESLTLRNLFRLVNEESFPFVIYFFELFQVVRHVRKITFVTR